MVKEQYFELNFTNDFERRFQLIGQEYLLTYTSYNSDARDRYANGDYRGIINIKRKKSDVPTFMKIKLYGIKSQKCVRRLVLSPGVSDGNFSIWDSFEDRSGPFVCSVTIRYKKWQKILDIDPKTDPTKHVTSSKSPIIECGLDNLSSDMKRLLEQGDGSDVILIAGSKEFRAHKLILSARSKVFCRMFEHPMKENLENRVTITDVPSEVLKELLTFIYTGVVSIKDMKMARDLYVAADKYDVKDLRAMCCKNLKDIDLDSVLDTLALADMYEEQDLKQSALDFISANYSQVKVHEKWKIFRKEDPVLALEVLNFIVTELNNEKL